MPADTMVAHLDESGTRLGGHRVYALAAVVTASSDRVRLEEAVSEFLAPGQSFLHHYDDTPDRRLAVAQRMAQLPLVGAVIMAEVCEARQQESTRHRLMCRLLPELQHAEQVEQVVIESRGGSDRADLRGVDRLRRSHVLTRALRVGHSGKADDPLLWIADYVVGSWISHEFRDEPNPWKLLHEAHLMEVRWMARRPESHDNAGASGRLRPRPQTGLLG